jgi:hypothetical protein
LWAVTCDGLELVLASRGHLQDGRVGRARRRQFEADAEIFPHALVPALQSLGDLETLPEAQGGA